jgi:smad nuclear-interacting protein 1
MSGTGGSTGPRRQSRWGGAASASASASAIDMPPPAVSQLQPSVTSAPPPVVTVTDHDALQALLSEVRAKEQQQAQKKRLLGKDNDNAPEERSNHNKRPKQRASGGTDAHDKNDSYYGPSGGGDGGVAVHEKETDATDATPAAPTDKPNFGLSGALAKDISRTGTAGGSRMYKGVLLKFQEPPEARAPVKQWRLYVYKNDQLEQTLHISKQSAYLIGRSPDICDILTAHPSCSTQHAVLQYRALPVPNKDESGGTVLHCQPYLLDLESTNGTFINGVRLDAARYYQCKPKDVLKFGASTREYVLLC